MRKTSYIHPIAQANACGGSLVASLNKWQQKTGKNNFSILPTPEIDTLFLKTVLCRQSRCSSEPVRACSPDSAGPVCFSGAFCWVLPLKPRGKKAVITPRQFPSRAGFCAAPHCCRKPGKTGKTRSCGCCRWGKARTAQCRNAGKSQFPDFSDPPAARSPDTPLWPAASTPCRNNANFCRDFFIF